MATVHITGRVLDVDRREGIGGLWVEAWQRRRRVARAGDLSAPDGRYSAEAEGDAVALDDGHAVLTPRVTREDGSDVVVVSPRSFEWPPESEALELEIEVELAPTDRAPAPIEDLAPVLVQPLPDGLVSVLHDREIATLEDVRRAGGAARLEGLGEPERAAARALDAFARLDVVSPDAAISRQLVDAHVNGVTELAEADAQVLADRSGIAADTIRELRQRAETYRSTMNLAFADAVIDTAPPNRIYTFNVSDSQAEFFRSHLPADPDPDACAGCGCGSAMSPAAYLVDLIDFLIDNFARQTVQSASPVQPQGFADLAAVEQRLYRPLGALTADCRDSHEQLRQIELAIEVLERYVLRKAPGLDREGIYKGFTYSPPAGPRFPKPDAVSDMFDAYLSELGVERSAFDAAIADAYPPAGPAPDLTKLNVLLGTLGVSEPELKGGLGLGAAKWEPGIKALDWLPTLVRKVKSKGLDPSDVELLLAYQDALARADTAIGRVKDAALPDIRGNLISYAIYPLAGTATPWDPAIVTTRALARHLHVDLESDACARTTRVEDAIEAIQSWIEAFRTGREDPGYFLMFAGGDADGDFEARWAWLKRYSVWQAAQSVFLYPEDYLLPSVRRSSTQPFADLLTALEDAETDAQEVAAAVKRYQAAIGGELPDPGLHDYPTSLEGVGLKSFHDLQQGAYATLTTRTEIELYDEWYCFVPLAVADRLSAAGAHEQAAAWLHNVFYPFAGNAPSDVPFPPVRLVWDGFSRTGSDGYDYRETAEWLQDPFNPFGVASTRQGAFLRHTVIRYVENLLDWADAEFVRDTSESIRRARELYELADTVLGAGETPPDDACRLAWQALLAQVAATCTPEQTRLLLRVLAPLQGADARLVRSDLAKLASILGESKPFSARATEAKQLVDQIQARPTQAKTIAGLLDEQKKCFTHQLELEDAFNRGGVASTFSAGRAPAADASVAERAARKVVCGFCVPPNPVLATLRFRIATNLEKIRTCRNAAGMQRALPTYAAAADAGVAVAAGGGDVENAVPSEPPPVFRFSYLIDRARNSAEIARQLETQLLNAFEREDAERYSLLKARQDVRAADANQSLHELKNQEARDGVVSAQRQRDRSTYQKAHFDGLANAGLSSYEREAIERLWKAYDWQTVAAATKATGALGGAVVGTLFGPEGSAAGAILGLIASAISTGGAVFQDIAVLNTYASQARSLQASYERRQEDWRYQSELAHWDENIGQAAMDIANDRVAIATQEREIARLQGDFASEVVEFLGAKFLNLELWVWMGRLLRRYYRTLLDVATTTARMAQRALEFERQESVAIIAPHYGDREKRDLLGAEQLLTDIATLDQHRLTTEKRRKELTKTISLAQLDPISFATLQSEGFMTFATPMSLFDRDFPGHYLRLVKEISLTVVALVPPAESVHATLSNSGVSRVMAGLPFEQPRVIQRQPESIAVTSAANGTGLFELRLDDPILLPFEGAGVDTSWSLEMPKGANRFDFETLVDVLFTMRYTALDDLTYREQVLKNLGLTSGRELSTGGMVSFPLRSSLPDEWFDLFNPQFADPSEYGFEAGQIKPPYLMQFELARGDFPPNERRHALARLNLALRESRPVPVPIELWFRPAGKVDEYRLDALADPASGPLSLTAFSESRTGPTAAWQTVPTPLAQISPFGAWRLRLRNEDTTANLVVGEDHNQNRIALDWLEDALFVVGYSASVDYRYADAV